MVYDVLVGDLMREMW